MKSRMGFLRTCLVVQWLRLPASRDRDVCLIPGWGTRIPQATWYGQKKKKATAAATEWTSETPSAFQPTTEGCTWMRAQH